VVSADGKQFRHAPLPIADSTPRVFAAIATSLLDEIMMPPPDAPNVNVDVHVDVNGVPVALGNTPSAPPPRVAVADPAPTLAPPGDAVAESRPEDDTYVRGNHLLFEIGPMLSPLSIGVEAELTYPITEQFRIGAMVGINDLFTESHDVLFVADGEIRRVGRGRTHNDIGLVGGIATPSYDPVQFIGFRLERVWEGDSRGTALSIVPLL